MHLMKLFKVRSTLVCTADRDEVSPLIDRRGVARRSSTRREFLTSASVLFRAVRIRTSTFVRGARNVPSAELATATQRDLFAAADIVGEISIPAPPLATSTVADTAPAYSAQAIARVAASAAADVLSTRQGQRDISEMTLLALPMFVGRLRDLALLAEGRLRDETKLTTELLTFADKMEKKLVAKEAKAAEESEETGGASASATIIIQDGRTSPALKASGLTSLACFWRQDNLRLDM
ncbi:hypothetical protein B0H21DRAFT_708946 [Amylocystis lapponica]|nr:hypothetical protein B0H21DRAFT_708946 [Amylocystis lapponica]